MLLVHLRSSAQTSYSQSQPPSTHRHTHCIYAHTHPYTEKDKSKFQVTIQSILSQSAIIGWRRMEGEQKSIGQRGWRRPNWCQLKLQHRCRIAGLPPQLLWKSTSSNLYHSALLISLSPLVWSDLQSSGEQVWRLRGVFSWGLRVITEIGERSVRSLKQWNSEFHRCFGRSLNDFSHVYPCLHLNMHVSS